MKIEIDKVYRWQSIFGRRGHLVSDKPIVISNDLARRRVSFLYEEIQEYLDANESGDLVGILDALCDILYFLFGMVVIHGMQNIFTEAFNIVHESNMSKMNNDGKPEFREDGKILKGENYWSPKEKLSQLFKIRG